MVRANRRRRLTGTGAFDVVFRTGRRSDGEFLQLVTVTAAGACGRIGFVISRKVLRRAVDRNRVRRMLRVVLREARPAIDDLDVIVRIRRPLPKSAFPRVVDEAVRMLASLLPARAPA